LDDLIPIAETVGEQPKGRLSPDRLGPLLIIEARMRPGAQRREGAAREGVETAMRETDLAFSIKGAELRTKD
jgi:hypothetical protein